MRQRYTGKDTIGDIRVKYFVMGTGKSIWAKKEDFPTRELTVFGKNINGKICRANELRTNVMPGRVSFKSFMDKNVI